ncbi:MAG: hypothetical protein ACN4EP_11295 [Sediminibacterium sp.]
MKKIFILAAVTLLATIFANAQTFAEWFQQSKTQKKYLLQQIAALQVYINYAQKGYDIAGKGINTIRSIKNGDFSLHNTFLSSFKNINPAISRYAKVADIISYQVRIIKETKQTINHIKEAKQFTLAEIRYCNRVFDNLLKECIKNVDELVLVTTPNELEMKDDERINRIDKLYLDMQDKYSFCKSFSKEMSLLSIQRLHEQNEINFSKTINGLK